jgi:hypothetical protein
VVETKTAMTPMMVVPVGRAVLVQSINSTSGMQNEYAVCVCSSNT